MSATFGKLAGRRLLAAPLALALALVLAACDGDDNGDPAQVGTPNTQVPTQPTTPTVTTRNVSACLGQTILPATASSPAITVASLVLPDTLKLDFRRPTGFPNGRTFDDPVIDLELAALLLDLTKHPVNLLVGGLNPAPPSDNATTTVFPFLKAAPGGQPQPGTATTFDFRTDPPTSYVRVDRMGNPAIATALIGSTTGAAGLAVKDQFNDADPADDVTQRFVPEAVSQLTTLHNVLIDDLTTRQLTPCSTPG